MGEERRVPHLEVERRRSTQWQTEAVGSRELRGLNLHDGYLLCFTLSVPASLSQLPRGHLQTLAQTLHKCHFVLLWWFEMISEAQASLQVETLLSPSLQKAYGAENSISLRVTQRV